MTLDRKQREKYRQREREIKQRKKDKSKEKHITNIIRVLLAKSFWVF